MDQWGAQAATHPTNEMEVVTDATMRHGSVSGGTEKPVVVQERAWGFAARTDPSVTLEEYLYWAKIEREMEAEEERAFHAKQGRFPLINLIKAKLSKDGRARLKAEKAERAMALQSVTEAGAQGKGLNGEKNPMASAVSTSPTRSEEAQNPLKVYDAEWRLAARALRTASWGQVRVTQAGM